jgi:dTDP-4-dehydrorhamnose reductase
MKIAVTGAAGLFGHGLVQTFREKHEVFPLTRQDGDITDEKRMRELLERIRPNVIVHPAGIPDIDECELNPEKAYRVNTEATRALAGIARDLDAGFAFISTDAVFDGQKGCPYVETDPVNPPSTYGKTKVAAENEVRKHNRHWIFRVSLLFGPGKANFVNRGLCKVTGGEPYAVASDQLGSATYTVDAATTMLELFAAAKYGTFHLCNQGGCTRYDLARRAVELAGLNISLVTGRPMQEMKRPGPRLKYAVMDMRALTDGGVRLPRRWEEALEAYIKTLAVA